MNPFPETGTDFFYNPKPRYTCLVCFIKILPLSAY